MIILGYTYRRPVDLSSVAVIHPELWRVPSSLISATCCLAGAAEMAALADGSLLNSNGQPLVFVHRKLLERKLQSYASDHALAISLSTILSFMALKIGGCRRSCSLPPCRPARHTQGCLQKALRCSEHLHGRLHGLTSAAWPQVVPWQVGTGTVKVPLVPMQPCADAGWREERGGTTSGR